VPPRTHLTLRVTLPVDAAVVRGAGPAWVRTQPEQTWLVDVGFGSSPAGPILLDDPEELGDVGPQEIDGWTYDVVRGDRRGTWDLRELDNGSWVRQYQFDDAITVPVDVMLSNWYTSTYPESWFVRTPVVVRRDQDAIHSLVGRAYTVTRPGHVKERRELPGEMWTAALRNVFGLTFTEEEQASLLATADGT
jgi:N-hydroxyarylamine O-acetyltransferase